MCIGLSSTPTSSTPAHDISTFPTIPFHRATPSSTQTGSLSPSLTCPARATTSPRSNASLPRTHRVGTSYRVQPPLLTIEELESVREEVVVPVVAVPPLVVSIETIACIASTSVLPRPATATASLGVLKSRSSLMKQGLKVLGLQGSIRTQRPRASLRNQVTDTPPTAPMRAEVRRKARLSSRSEMYELPRSWEEYTTWYANVRLSYLLLPAVD